MGVVWKIIITLKLISKLERCLNSERKLKYVSFREYAPDKPHHTLSHPYSWTYRLLAACGDQAVQSFEPNLHPTNSFLQLVPTNTTFAYPCGYTVQQRLMNVDFAQRT